MPFPAGIQPKSTEARGIAERVGQALDQWLQGDSGEREQALPAARLKECKLELAQMGPENLALNSSYTGYFVSLTVRFRPDVLPENRTFLRLSGDSSMQSERVETCWRAERDSYCRMSFRFWNRELPPQMRPETSQMLAREKSPDPVTFGARMDLQRHRLQGQKSDLALP